MNVIITIKEMQDFSNNTEKTIGFVPTMGFLHDGHLSLIKEARKECDIVVVSIFVNPTQFAPGEDLDKYPRDFERDKELCEKENVDIIFYPSETEMYEKNNLTTVKVEKITNILCGKTRPTHFQGVTTIVNKLLNIIKPNIAYFGQKDYQQSVVIKKMVKDLNIDTNIKVCPIIREEDGLAMSSRNRYLSNDERKQALCLSNSLKLAQEMIQNNETDTEKIKRTIKELIIKQPSAKVDYVEIVDAETLQSVDMIKDNVAICLAVFISNTRLIDNWVR